MLLKGYTNSGQRIDFTLSDCPIFITDKIIALAGIKMSQLIKIDTIVRGDIESRVYEGDFVLENGILIGYVVYSKGFMLQDLHGNIKNIPEGEHIELKEGNSDSVLMVSKVEKRTEIVFSYNGDRLKFENFLSKSGNHIATVGGKFPKRLIEPSHIKFFTGLVVDEKQLFFGDICEEGVVVLHNYLPSIKVGEVYCKILCSE